MAAQGNVRIIYAALGANAAIAVTKFIASAVTGSSAMFAEGVHSVVDTGNQGLLLWGIRQAKRPPDAMHPFGYGKELYFWAFMVAIVIFGLGSGFAAYEGIHKLQDPDPVAVSWINYAVLSAAFGFESFAWWMAFKALREVRGELGWIEAVRRSKDPTLFTVLFEDSAAMLGLIIAFFGILAANVTGDPFYDALATLCIAFVLAATAIFLAIECKGLLTGEAASPKLVAEIRAEILAAGGIKGVNELLTMHFGPSEVLVTASVDFEDGIDSLEVERTVSRIENALRSRFSEVKRVFIEAQNLSAHLARVTKDGGAAPAPAGGGA